VATHARTQSRIVVAIVRTEGLVGRTQCESLAQDLKLAPQAVSATRGTLQTIEEEVAITQQTFDTRIRVAIVAGAAPGSPLVGHVMAFGGFLRKCYIFDFSTEVSGAADEPVLSSRLAFARARILGGLELDPFGVVTRTEPVGPDVAPAR
jgi:hypothetical protein